MEGLGDASKGARLAGFEFIGGEDKRIMELLSHDILIVAEAERVAAAIAIGETHPKFQVGVISKVYPMRSHTVSAEGGAAAVIKATTALTLMRATQSPARIGWRPGRRGGVCPRSAGEMIHWSIGLSLSRDPDGTWPCALLAHEDRADLVSQPIRPGSTCSTRYFRLRRNTTTSSVTMNGSSRDCSSMKGECKVCRYRAAHRQVRAISGKAVILCTGGGGRFSRSPPMRHQDRRRHGPGLSRRRAAQGHGVRPIPSDRLARHRILITEAARSEGDPRQQNGYRYLQDYNLGQPSMCMIRSIPSWQPWSWGRRSAVAGFTKERDNGRTITLHTAAMSMCPPGRAAFRTEKDCKKIPSSELPELCRH